MDHRRGRGDDDFAVPHPYPPQVRSRKREQPRGDHHRHAHRHDNGRRDRPQNGGEQSGTVKWFNAGKGYGFITPVKGERDVFVHISAVLRAGEATLREGQHISYEIHLDRNERTSAVNLRIGD